MRTVTLIALVLVIVGGLNWLLVGLFQYDLVADLFGGQNGALARLIYILVGLSAVWLIFRLPSLIEVRTAHRADTVGTGTLNDPLHDRNPRV